MKFTQFLWKMSGKKILMATLVGAISGSGNAVLISTINRCINEAAFPHAAFYFIVLSLSVLVTSIISQFLLIDISQNAIHKLRLQLSQSILSSPLSHLEKMGENRLLATAIEDIRSLSHSLSAIPSICVDFATVVVSLVYLAWLSGPIFALTISISAISIGYVQSRVKKAHQLFQSSRQEEDTLLKHFQSITKGIKELKLNRSRREDFSANHLSSSVSKLRQKNSTAMKSMAVANSLGQFAQFSTLGFTVFVLPWLMHVPLSMLSSYVLISSFLSMPLQNILNRIPDLLRANIALDKIKMMELSLVNEATTEVTYHNAIQPTAKLELDQITYIYNPEENHELPLSPLPEKRPDREMKSHHHRRSAQSRELNGNNKHLSDSQEKGFLLGPISMTLEPGEVTFLVGGNGSGKSTLAKLITGLYAPQSGSIYLNGALITDQDQEWYRQHFSAIFSDFYLFEQCLGFDRVNLDRDVEKYLRELQLDRQVQVKDGTLSTINLSQGQRKRLALLTAYLEDRPIYLFDEWASDQDPLFRDLFYREILVKLKERGKTILVISHDDRYFHLADQIIKLEYGKISPKACFQQELVSRL
jgi:putative pyoverdin transport system ATP-binding/permease protein